MRQAHLVLMQVEFSVDSEQWVVALGQVGKDAVKRFHAGQRAEQLEDTATWVDVAKRSFGEELVIWNGIATRKSSTPRSQEVLGKMIEEEGRLGRRRKEDGVSVKYAWCLAVMCGPHGLRTGHGVGSIFYMEKIGPKRSHDATHLTNVLQQGTNSPWPSLCLFYQPE